MSQMDYRPSKQSSSQQQNQNKNQYQKKKYVYVLEEAKRPPVAKVSAWVINKTTGTVLEGLFKFLLGESLIGRLTMVVLISLLVGALTDLVVVMIPVLPIISDTNVLGFFISAPVILGGLAGAGAGRFIGAVLGGLWGWLIGQIADAVTAEMVSNQLESNITRPIVWILSALSGFLAGNVVNRILGKINNFIQIQYTSEAIIPEERVAEWGLRAFMFSSPLDETTRQNVDITVSEFDSYGAFSPPTLFEQGDTIPSRVLIKANFLEDRFFEIDWHEFPLLPVCIRDGRGLFKSIGEFKAPIRGSYRRIIP